MGLLMDYLTGGKKYQRDDDYDDYELTPRDKAAIKVAKEKVARDINGRYKFYAYCTECGEKSVRNGDFSINSLDLDSRPQDAIISLQYVSRGCGRFSHIARVELVRF